MKTIEEVISRLDEIIAWSIKNQNPAGYFASTYRIMTAAVLQGIKKKKFSDSVRMTNLDVIFAKRYIDAFDAYQNKQKCSNAWFQAFEAGKNKNLLIIQHIFLGMNAHINLDLGISAASVVPKGKINPLKADFYKINEVIASINQNVQNQLNKICYPIELVDQISNGKDNAVLDFAISRARDTSWASAVALSTTPNFLQPTLINLIDNAAAKIATQIVNPRISNSKILKDLKTCESNDVAKNIEILSSAKL